VTVPRFHVPDLVPGRVVALASDAAHHALDVLRLRAGSVVRVFDGEGREFEAAIDSAHRGRATLRVGESVAPRPESPLRILLALPPLKGDLLELVIQKATELGVTEIWPTLTARTDAAVRPALRGSRRERWARVASAAAEQCGRAVVPRVAPAADLPALAATPLAVPRLVFLEGENAPGLDRRPLSPPGVLALIGPPGGFEEAEKEMLTAAGFEPVSLGPRVLRTETAAIAAVSVLQLLWGDLGGPPELTST
jgi:16S rRNA (uracil1498-N3)-methyltransferase